MTAQARRTTSTLALGLGSTGLALALLTACGGGSSAGGGAHGGGGAATSTGAASSSPSTSATSSGATLATGRTKAGTVLVDGQGRTLYAFAADSRGHSACSGSCAQYWPPVPGADASARPAGVTATLGTVARADGTKQLTVNGWPMYTYAGDSARGQANGQGVNASGGLWWVVAPTGAWVKSGGGSGGTGRSY